MEELKREPNNIAPSSTQFILAEYKMLQDRFHSLRNEANSRLNFLITLTSATFGIVLIFGGNNFSSSFVKIATLIALFILSVVGYDVFRFMITSTLRRK